MTTTFQNEKKATKKMVSPQKKHQKQCSLVPNSLVCNSPSFLVKALPIFRSGAFSTGTYINLMDQIRENGCWISPPESNPKIKIDGSRDFKLKEMTLPLIHIQMLNQKLGHKIDHYSSEGEYKGQSMEWTTSGWTMAGDVKCD